MPGRTMYNVAFGATGATPEKLAIFGGIVLVAALIAAAIAIARRRAKAAA